MLLLPRLRGVKSVEGHSGADENSGLAFATGALYPVPIGAACSHTDAAGMPASSAVPAAASIGWIEQSTNTSIFQRPLSYNRAIKCAASNECQEENPFTQSLATRFNPSSRFDLRFLTVNRRHSWTPACGVYMLVARSAEALLSTPADHDRSIRPLPCWLQALCCANSISPYFWRLRIRFIHLLEFQCSNV